MPKPKTHEENLKSVCCVCGRKGKFQNVSKALAEKVVRLFQPTYDRDGGVHPTAICDSCRKACTETEKDPEQTRHRVPDFLDYSAIRPPGPSTRANKDAGCKCTFCAIGGLGMREEREHNSQISNPLGRPATAGEVEMMETDISIKICGDCKVQIRQGVKHICNKTEERRNRSNDLKSLSSGTLETILGEGLKEAQRRQQEKGSPDSTQRKNEVTLKSRFGGASPLTVTVGEKRKPRQLTNETMLKIRKKLGLSSVKTKQLGHMLRVGQNSRQAVESGLAEALVESNNLLEDLFTAEEVKVVNKKDEEELKTLVYCTDVGQLVFRLLEHRGLDEDTADIKIGLDGGGGSLKFTISIMDKEERIKTGRQTYAEGVGAKENTSGSTNKLMVLALLYDGPETYETVKMMMDKLDFDNVPASITSDIKMLLLLIGKCGGNLTHGCVFCSAAKPLTEEGDLYRLIDLHNLHLQFEEAGGDKKKQKNFQNIINKPLLNLEPDDYILGPVVPPELHLMLGVTDKGKRCLETEVFETETEGKDFMDQFLHDQNISKKGYKDSRSLEGNQTRTFLKSTTKLRDAYENVGKLQKADPIIKFLEIFSDVVGKCFGMKLDSGYKAALQSFSDAYMELHKEKPKTFTVTPKIHIVMYHVQEYLELMNAEEEEDRGLGYMSEQAFEAVHSDMNRMWNQGWKVSPTHKEFADKLKKFVVAYNSNNM